MKKVDVVIILGGGVGGTLKPSLYTKERLELFTSSRESLLQKPIIVSGRYSVWLKKKPRPTEAQVMKNYLIRKGIPKNNIFLEGKSRDTVGNAYYSKQIVKKHSDWKHILIVTTKGHTRRSQWIFNKVFGNKYKIHFLGVPSQTAFHHPNREKYERWIVGIYKKGLRSVRVGDDQKLLGVLKKFHPAFSKSEGAEEGRRQIIKTKKKLLGRLTPSSSK